MLVKSIHSVHPPTAYAPRSRTLHPQGTHQTTPFQNIPTRETTLGPKADRHTVGTRMIPRQAGRHAGTRRATSPPTAASASASASAARTSLVLTTPRITATAPSHAPSRPAGSYQDSLIYPRAASRPTGAKLIYPAESSSLPPIPPMPMPRPPVYSHRLPISTPFTSFTRSARSSPLSHLFGPPHARLTPLGTCSTTSMRSYSQQTQGQGRYIR